MNFFKIFFKKRGKSTQEQNFSNTGAVTNEKKENRKNTFDKLFSKTRNSLYNKEKDSLLID